MNSLYNNVKNKISKRFTQCLLIIMICFGGFAANAQTVIFVSQTGNNSNSGATWGQAKGPTFISTLGGTNVGANYKIYVKGSPTAYVYSNANGIQTNVGFQIKGGFPSTATGTDISGYDPVANPTTISITSITLSNGLIADGNAAGNVVGAFSIQGIRFNANGTGARIFHGTLGSSSSNIALDFRDDEFYNFNSNGNSPVTTQDKGTYNFDNCYFHDNSGANEGAAISILAQANATLTINNCSFVNNQETSPSQGGGGAVASVAPNNFITNSFFCNNKGASGGAIGNGSGALVALGNWTISNCTFSQNTATGFTGGAVNFNAGSAGGSVNISGCNFYSNQNTGLTFGGGALYLEGNYPSTVNNCIFYNNSILSTNAPSSASNFGGGAVLFAGANGTSNLTISNTVFDSNSVPSASWGGAIEYPTQIGIPGSNLVLNNVTFVNNKLGASTTANGSDIGIVWVPASGQYQISNSKMQLNAATTYKTYVSASSTPFVFGTGNTFSNTSGAITPPTLSCSTAIITPCLASDDPNPVLSVTTITNTCPSKTVDLTTITASNQNNDVTLTWHTGSVASDANKITTPTATNQGGTYYAAFYDPVGGCYSAGTTPISVIIGACSTVTNVCPVTTVDLTTLVNAGSLPITWHTGTPANDGNKVANPTAVGAGTYYAAFYDATGGCYSPTTGAVTVTIKVCVCTQPAATGTPDGYTKVGIITLNNLPSTGWPGQVPNGFLALASTNKGLVITRTTAASIAVPVEGMIIYDTGSNCIKLYNGTSWNCISKSCNN